jgi:hypothetical protein
MAFLTSSNFLSIISKIDINEIEESDDKVYEKPIYFLSPFEKKKLIGIQSFLADPENFTKEYYKKVDKEDTLKYIFEGGTPAYHLDSNCDRLNSSFTNYEIPGEIKEKGETEVKKFRDWFKQNMYLPEKPDVFTARLQLAFGLKNPPKPVDYDNSGIEKVENIELNELKRRINELLSKAGQYYVKSDDRKKNILKRFQKYTYLGFSKKEIQNNDTGFTDEAIKKFLRQYDEHFKKPVKALLIDYYRVKLNPTLNFEGNLLEQLGFKICANCAKNNANSTAKNEEDDTLPF